MIAQTCIEQESVTKKERGCSWVNTFADLVLGLRMVIGICRNPQHMLACLQESFAQVQIGHELRYGKNIASI